MTKDQITAVLERVRSWPEERQADAARALLEMEAQDKNEYRLTDEQVAVVRRRRTAGSSDRISFEDVFKRFRARVPGALRHEVPLRRTGTPVA